MPRTDISRKINERLTIMFAPGHGAYYCIFFEFFIVCLCYLKNNKKDNIKVHDSKVTKEHKGKSQFPFHPCLPATQFCFPEAISYLFLFTVEFVTTFISVSNMVWVLFLMN